VFLDALERAIRREFRRISRVRIEDRPFDPDNWIRIKGARELAVENRGALRELYIARDAIARDMDRAPYRVLNESALVDLAQRLPQNAAALRRAAPVGRHLHAGQVELLLAAVARGREVQDLQLPRRQGRGPADRFGAGPLAPDQLAAFDALRAWRGQRAETRGVEVARVATNALLSAIVRAHPASLSELAAVEGMEDWRLREYAEEILAVLRGGGGDGDGATAC